MSEPTPPPAATSWRNKFLLCVAAVAVGIGLALYFGPTNPNAYLADCLQKKECRIIRYEYVSNGPVSDAAVPQGVIDQGRDKKQTEVSRDDKGTPLSTQECTAFVLPAFAATPKPPELTERNGKTPEQREDVLMDYIERLLANASTNAALLEVAYRSYQSTCTLPVIVVPPPTPPVPGKIGGYNPLTMPATATVSSANTSGH